MISDGWSTSGVLFAVCLGLATGVPAQTPWATNGRGLPSDMVLAVAEDADGRLWCATDAGTAYYSDGRWNAVDERRRGNAGPLRRFARADDGHLLAVRETADQGLWIFDGQMWQLLDGSTDCAETPLVEFVVAGTSTDPRVLARTPGGSLLHFESGRWQEPTEFAPTPIQGPQALARLPGGFAIASMHGCVSPDGTTLTWSTHDPLRSGKVAALTAAHPASSGRIAWIRTPRRLFAVDAARDLVVAEFPRDRATADLVLLALPDDGVVEIAGDSALRFDPDRQRGTAVDLGPLDATGLRSACVDSLGLLWIPSDQGLLRTPGLDRLPFAAPPGHRVGLERLSGCGLAVRSGDRLLRTDLPAPARAPFVLPSRLADRPLGMLVDTDDTLLLAAGRDGLLAVDLATSGPGPLREVVTAGVRDVTRDPAGTIHLLGDGSIGELAPDGSIRRRAPVPRGVHSLRFLADGRAIAFGDGTPLYIRPGTDDSWTQASLVGGGREHETIQVVDVAMDPMGRRILVATDQGICEFADRGLAPRRDLGVAWGEPCLGVDFLADGTLLVATRRQVLVHDDAEADPLNRPDRLEVDDLRPLLGMAVDAMGDVFVFGERGATRYAPDRPSVNALPLGVDVVRVGAHGVHVAVRGRERPDRSRILRWRIAGSADTWRQGIARADGIFDSLALPVGSGPFRVELQARDDSGRWSPSRTSEALSPPDSSTASPLGAALILVVGALFGWLTIRGSRRRRAARRHTDLALDRRAEALIRDSQLPILVTDAQGRIRASTTAARTYFAQAGFTRCPMDGLQRPEISNARCPALSNDSPNPGQRFGMLPQCRTCDLVMTRWPDSVPGLEVTVFQDRGIERSLARMAPGAWRSRVMDQVARQTALDLGDLLTTVSGFTELALRELPEDGPGLHDLERVLHTAREGRELVQRLTSFERAALATSSNSLAERLRNVEPLLRSVLGSSVRLEWSVSLGSTFLADAEGELEDALVELCSNAREAIPGAGSVRVVGRVDNGRGVVQLVVADDGRGMSSEVLARAREMFFSTRADHRALGLGLAGVGAYCRRLGGEMSIDSSLGGGTRIELLLPTARDPARKRTRRPQALVVTADRESSELARSSLHQLGYEMRVASCGPDAMREFDSATGCELLMIDLLAPSDERIEVLTHCRERCPGIAVVFLTSYAKAVADRTARSSHECFLRRPWTSQELAEALDSLHADRTTTLPSRPPTMPIARLTPHAGSNAPATP